MIEDPRGGEAGAWVQRLSPPIARSTSPFVAKAAVPGPLRDLCLSCWAACRQDWRKAAPIVRETMRDARWLHSRDRRDFSEHLYQMIKWERLLGFLLDRAGLGPGAAGSTRDLAMHLAGLCVEWGLPAAEAAAQMATHGIDWDVVADRGHTLLAWTIETPREPAEAIGLATSFPTWLVRRLGDELGWAEAAALLVAWNTRAPLWLRLNPGVKSRDELMAGLESRGIRTRAGTWSGTAVELVDRVDVFSLPELKTGAIDVQDEGSQLIAEICGARPGQCVVDACAGAGGKSLALAALMGNTGRILAADVRPAMLRHALRRARRGAASIIEVVPLELDGPLPAPLTRLPGGGADLVLVDAPCSGTGALRRNPEARWHLSPLEAMQRATLQASILDRFAPIVRPGGRLVYATCAIGRTENDEVIASFLARDRRFRPVPLKELVGQERAAALGGDTLRVMPHIHGTDGFFAAVLEAGPR